MATTKYQVVVRFQKSTFHIRGNAVSAGMRSYKASALTQEQMAKLHKEKHPGIELKAASGKQG